MSRVPRLTTIISLVVVAGAGLFVLVQLQPSLLVTDTTPAGGDMGAHVWGPAFLRDSLLPDLRLTGWTQDWYAGFPAYHFYFLLPSLLVVLLDVVLPYGIAFKLVSVSGAVSLPVAAWAFARLVRLPFPLPPLMAVATVPFLFDRFHTIWGGNIPATLAGEFAFSIALTLALLFLGVLARSLETGRYRALAAALLAATALSHLLPTAFAVVGMAVLLLSRRPDRARWRLGVTLSVVAFALAAFWVLPFLARLPYSNDMGWERTDAYLQNLMPFLRADAAGADHIAIVAPLGLAGAILGAARRRRGAIVVAAVTVVFGLGFTILWEGPIWNARLLPFWYLGLYLLAATAIGEVSLLVGDWWARRGSEPEPLAIASMAPDRVEGPQEPDTARREIPQIVALALGVLATLSVVGGPLGVVPGWFAPSSDRSFIPDWARWNYSGYEQKTSYPEFREVVATMARVGRERGCGRAMWEYEPQLDRYGTPMALMLLPHWTDRCIGSMEGLFFESSATVPYHFLNQSELSKTPSRAMRDLPYRDLDVAAGVDHLQLLGVQYYMALSPEIQAQARVHPDLELVATTTPYPVNYDDGTHDRHWEIYEVAGAQVVEPLEFEPVVVEGDVHGREGWLDLAVPWYQDSDRWDVPLAAAGPAEWERVESAEADAPRTPVRANRVSDVRIDDAEIQFRVSRPGVPVLVKVSYFPNWSASGADGPWRVAPNLMVVVPTAEEVTLSYGRTGVDLLGWLITAAGLVALAVLARRPAVRLPEPDRPTAVEPWVDPFAVAPPGPPEDEPARVSAE